MSDGSDWAASLRDSGFAGEIRTDQPLASHTTWRIGGPAALIATPGDTSDLQRIVAWLGTAGVPWRVMGNGSNLLVDDRGFPGVVLRIRKAMDRLSSDGRRLTAGAGASFPATARHATSLGLSGIEFGAGIPGTIGGALIMNAGWHAYEIGNLVHTVSVLDREGTLRRLAQDDCRFDYRNSALRGGDAIVVACELDLQNEDPAAIRDRLETFAASRKQNQPTEMPSCGSVFLKPPGDFAGRLIEQAGLKGARVGGIEVSTKHANFFVNSGGGTSSQVLELVDRVERKVHERFGVQLVREFEYWA